MDADQRRTVFEALVLQALWLLVRYAAGMKPTSQAHGWRANALAHMDANGVQTNEAKEYRRETSFPPLNT
jgi:hypothetical protein